MKNSLDYNVYWSTTSIRERGDHPLRSIVESYRKPGHTVLEIGPGTRPTVPIAGSHFIDTAESAIAQLEAYGGIGAVGDANRALAYADNTFDLACAFDVLEHLENDEGACREIARTLKPYGRFIFSVPMYQHHWTAFDTFVGHWRRYDPKMLEELFRKTGLSVERIYASSSSWFSFLVSLQFIKALITFLSFSSPVVYPILGFCEKNIGLNFMHHFIAPLKEFNGSLKAVPPSTLRVCIVCRKSNSSLSGE